MRFFALTLVVLCLGVGCASKDSYVTSETGPHGVVTVKRVKYTPEEIAARQEADRYSGSRPTDPQMVAIEKNWPKLTEEQRITIQRTIEQMTAGK